MSESFTKRFLETATEEQLRARLRSAVEDRHQAEVAIKELADALVTRGFVKESPKEESGGK